MAQHFNAGRQVPGATYVTSAFGTRADEGQIAWTEGAPRVGAIDGITA